MRSLVNCLVVALLFLLLPFELFAQEVIIIKGRVTDAGNGEPIPFVNVTLKGTVTGTTTDFDGFYSLKTKSNADSVRAMYLGYKSRLKKVKRGVAVQVIDFQLENDAKSLGEVTVLAGENPAWPIMRAAIKNKDKYNYVNLSSYNCESYTKIQLSVDNVSESIKKRKAFKPLTNIFDTLKVLAGEDGKPNLPVFYSENLSDLYYLNNGVTRIKKEIIKASKIKGVGVDDGMLSSQYTGASFEEYNFNRNNLTILNKEFISPLADGAFIIYEFYLLDSSMIEDKFCYKIRIKPKNPLDLAFTGNIWIAKDDYALKQVNVEIPKTANVNFIDNLRVQQELVPLPNGVWFPSKVRTVIDFADITNNAVGLVAKTYSSYKNVVLNNPKPLTFFDKAVELSEGATEVPDTFWSNNRHEQLTNTDKNVLKMIDTINKLPVIHGVTEIIKLVSIGYVGIGKIDIGPLVQSYGFNTIEGSKLRFGMRTNYKFSKEWILSGYVAFGLRDEKFKYNAQIERILSRKHWTKLGIERREDIDQIGQNYDYDVSVAFDEGQGSFYTAGSQINRFAFLNRKTENRIWLESEFTKGFTGRVVLQNIDRKHFFQLKTNESSSSGQLLNDFSTTEIKLEGRMGLGEVYLVDRNRRRLFQKSRIPVIRVGYTLGIKNVLNSDFDYQKLDASISHKLRIGVYGFTRYRFGVGKVFSKIPYTLLEIHRGNQTPFYATATYNLMNYFEFVSDQFVEANLEHHFEGLIFNRVPLFKKLKLREFAGVNGVYGNLSKFNSQYNSSNQFSTLSKRPYIEAFFGVENILKCIRLDFLYRLSYTNADYREQYKQLQLNNGIRVPYDINNFGIKFSLDLSF